MNVVCFHAALHPATEWSLRQFAPDAVFEDVSGSEWDYWRGVRKYWTGEEDLVVIEHDIEITDEVIPAFASCYADWCTFSYEMAVPGVWITEGLGCARFSARLQLEVPAEMIYFGDHSWRSLDVTISTVLKRNGAAVINPYASRHGGTVGPHVHGGLMHHHPYRKNPICVRDGVIPDGTIHDRQICRFCDEDNV